MKKGLGEGEEAPEEEEEEERKAGMTTAEEERGRQAERGRREKVQREAEVGVLREAEQVGRRRKVSVCLVGYSSTRLCFVFLYSHQSDAVSHDAPWLPDSHHYSSPRLQTGKRETNFSKGRIAKKMMAA